MKRVIFAALAALSSWAPVTAGSVSIPLTRISAYNAVAGQTDATPTIGACGRLPRNAVGISRDLLKVFPCGTWVKVTSASGRTYVGVVADTMNARYSRAVDLLVPTRNEAIRLGVSTGRIEKLR